MYALLPDSKGLIRHIFYHHSPIRIGDTLIHEEILLNFLQCLNKVGKKPKLSVISTHVTDEEKVHLKIESRKWEKYVSNFFYKDVRITRDLFTAPPYAQDIGVVLEHPCNSFIISKSDRVRNFPGLVKTLEKVLERDSIRTQTFNIDYNLEGGYLLATSDNLFYSNPLDKDILKIISKKRFFIEDLISQLIKKILKIYNLVGVTIADLPTHVDMMLSFLERGDVLEIFYIDFKESTLLNPFLNMEQYQSLERIFDEWNQSINKLLSRISKEFKNTRVHKMPGVIAYDEIQTSMYGISGKSILPYIYSGVNLLFHSYQKKDFAFYLKYPSDIEVSKGLSLNAEIENYLKSINVHAIPISGKYEVTNMNHIHNSAGMRCLIKVMSRTPDR